MAAEFTKLKVLSYRQQLSVFPSVYETMAVEPGSMAPFLFSPLRRDAKLIGAKIKVPMIKLRLEILKDGETFWVGVAVPVGTSDFSRCYIYFYPDTLENDDGYKTFKGWGGLEQNYLEKIGVQMTAAKNMALILPYTTNASRSNDAKHNLFASHGVETLNDIMTAIQMEISHDPIAMAAGQAVKVQPGSLKAIGVASFSSGVNHVNRFVNKVGGSGLIREIIDFDGQHIKPGARPIKQGAPVLSGAVNWWVTQNSHPDVTIMGSVQLSGTATARKQLTKPRGWIHIPPEALRDVPLDRVVGNDAHDKIGRMMFAAMMSISTLP